MHSGEKKRQTVRACKLIFILRQEIKFSFHLEKNNSGGLTQILYILQPAPDKSKRIEV